MNSSQNINRVYAKPNNINNNVNTNNSFSSSNNSESLLVVTNSQELANYDPPGLKSNDASKELKVRDLREYLCAQNAELLDRLYNYNTICVAVYRELTEAARQFVIRILFVDQPVPRAVIASWASQHYAKEQNECERLLKKLNIWRLTAIPGGLEAWELCPSFKRNLKIGLLGGGRHLSLSPFPLQRSKPRDIAFLDNYAMSRWRCVLHYLVGIGNTSTKTDDNVSPDAVRTLINAGLMRNTHTTDGCVLTQLGFQFLLLDTQSQVWHFMLSYLEHCHLMGLALPECFAFLFQLSTATLGRDYSSDGFSPNKLMFLQHLREFGLVFQRKRKEGRFYPTRLAVAVTMHGSAAKRANLLSMKHISNNLITQNTTIPTSTSASTSTSNNKDSNKDNNNTTETLGEDYSAAFDLKVQLTGFLVVETNYRIYAHTDSELHLAVLGLFTELLFRFPRFAICQLSRDAMRQAFRVGITAKQIIKFLEQHAHPCMRKLDKTYESNSVLPPTIVDQINIWEKERIRFSFEEGVIYNSFLSVADFAVLRDYAQSIEALIWQNERLRSLIVTKQSHDDVKRYWKRYSKSTF